MASISTNYYNYSQDLFSTSSSSSSTTTSTSSSNPLGDYMSIKNGSYKKLLKAYYKKQEAENSTTSSDGTVSSEDKKQLLTVKSSSDSLQTATNNLISMDSYEDKDELVKSVNEFVKAYNSTIEASADQDNLSILRKTAIMTSGIQANSKMLSKIGISIGTDNKLTVDETKLKAANTNDLDTLFNGSTSFMTRISQKATDISSLAVSAVNQGKLYGVNGKFSSTLNTSVLINSLV